MSKVPRLIFYGTPEFAVPTLQELINNKSFNLVAVVTQPDRPSGRGNKLQPSPIKVLASQHNLPIIQPENIKKDLLTFEKELEKLGPLDLAVVLAFGQIIPLSILNFPNLGSVNIHGSLLPRWRGAAPIQRAIEAGDAKTGVCLMQMEAGLDSGPVYSSRSINIDKSDTFGSLHDRLAKLSAEIISEDLIKIINQDLTAIPQQPDLVTYAKKITRLEEKIDWNRPALETFNKVRALAPFPGSFTTYHNQVIKVLATEIRPEAHQQKPGTVIFADKSRLEIACQDFSLLIKTIKPEGKRVMSIQEYLQGHNFTIGECLE